MTILVESLIKVGVGVFTGAAIGGSCYAFQILANADGEKRTAELERIRHEHVMEEAKALQKVK